MKTEDISRYNFNLYILNTFHSRHYSFDHAMDMVGFESVNIKENTNNEFEYSIYAKITEESTKGNTYLRQDYSKLEKYKANQKSYKSIFNGEFVENNNSRSV